MHPVFNPVAPYRYLLTTVYLCMADMVNPDLFVCCCRTWIYLDITQKTVNRASMAGGGRCQHNLPKTAV